MVIAGIYRQASAFGAGAAGGDTRQAFIVGEVQAAIIRTTYKQRGEFPAAVELRQLFPGIDNVPARECVRTIVSWRH